MLGFCVLLSSYIAAAAHASSQRLTVAHDSTKQCSIVSHSVPHDLLAYLRLHACTEHEVDSMLPSPPVDAAEGGEEAKRVDDGLQDLSAMRLQRPVSLRNELQALQRLHGMAAAGTLVCLLH